MQRKHRLLLGWALVLTVAGLLLRAVGLPLWLVVLAYALALVLTLVVPRWGVEVLDHLIYRVREAYWRADTGRFHAHRGLAMRIDDDGRHVWVAGADLQRQLGTHDSEPVLCARHAGRWRRDDDGQLMLRVDAVVQHLSTMPGRADPTVVRLRRYFEREVLFPAAERRRRSA